MSGAASNPQAKARTSIQNGSRTFLSLLSNQMKYAATGIMPSDNVTKNTLDDEIPPFRASSATPMITATKARSRYLFFLTGLSCDNLSDITLFDAAYIGPLGFRTSLAISLTFSQ